MIWLLPMYPTSYFVIFPPYSLYFRIHEPGHFPSRFSDMLSLPQGRCTCFQFLPRNLFPQLFLAWSSYSLGLNTVTTCLIEVCVCVCNSLFLCCTQNGHEINSCVYFRHSIYHNLKLLHLFTYCLPSSSGVDAP